MEEASKSPKSILKVGVFSGRDDNTTSGILAGASLKRISFSGKNCIRVFNGEEEAKTWHNSYEISDEEKSGTGLVDVHRRRIALRSGRVVIDSQCIKATSFKKKGKRAIATLENKENHTNSLESNNESVSFASSIAYIEKPQQGAPTVEHGVDVNLLEQENICDLPSFSLCEAEKKKILHAKETEPTNGSSLQISPEKEECHKTCQPQDENTCPLRNAVPLTKLEEISEPDYCTENNQSDMAITEHGSQTHDDCTQVGLKDMEISCCETEIEHHEAYRESSPLNKLMTSTGCLEMELSVSDVENVLVCSWPLSGTMGSTSGNKEVEKEERLRTNAKTIIANDDAMDLTTNTTVALFSELSLQDCSSPNGLVTFTNEHNLEETNELIIRDEINLFSEAIAIPAIENTCETKFSFTNQMEISEIEESNQDHEASSRNSAHHHLKNEENTMYINSPIYETLNRDDLLMEASRNKSESLIKLHSLHMVSTGNDDSADAAKEEAEVSEFKNPVTKLKLPEKGVVNNTNCLKRKNNAKSPIRIRETIFDEVAMDLSASGSTKQRKTTYMAPMFDVETLGSKQQNDENSKFSMRDSSNENADKTPQLPPSEKDETILYEDCIFEESLVNGGTPGASRNSKRITMKSPNTNLFSEEMDMDMDCQSWSHESCSCRGQHATDETIVHEINVEDNVNPVFEHNVFSDKNTVLSEVVKFFGGTEQRTTTIIAPMLDTTANSIIIDVEKLEDKSQEASKSSSEGNTRSRYTNLFSKNMDLDCPSWSHESSSYLGHHGTDGTIVKNVNGKDKPNSVFEKNDFSDNNSVLFEDTRKLSNIGDTEQRRTTYIAPMLDGTPNRITSDVEKLEGKSEKESKISDHRNTKSRHTNLLSVNMDLDYQSWPNKSECLGQYGTNDPLVQKINVEDNVNPVFEHNVFSDKNTVLSEVVKFFGGTEQRTTTIIAPMLDTTANSIIIDVEKLEDKSQEASKSSSEGNTRSRYTNLFSKNMDLDCPSWSHESSSYLGHHGTDRTIVKNVNGKDKPNSVFEKNDFSDNNSVLFEDTRKLSNIGDTEQRRTTYIAPMLDGTPNRITSDVEKLEGKSEKESKISDHRNTKSRHTNLLSVNMDLDYQSWPNKSECLGQYGTNDPLVQKINVEDNVNPVFEHNVFSDKNTVLSEVVKFFGGTEQRTTTIIAPMLDTTANSIIIDVEKLEDKSQEASKSSSEGNTRSRYTNLFSKNMDLDCPSWSHESSSYLGHHGTDRTIVKNVNGKDKPNSVFEKNDFSDNNSVLFEDTRKLSNIGDTEQRRTTYIAPMLDGTPNRITSDVEKLEGKSEKESKISDHRNTKSRHTNLLSVNMDLDYQSWPNKSECLGQYGTNDPLVQKINVEDNVNPVFEHNVFSDKNTVLSEVVKFFGGTEQRTTTIIAPMLDTTANSIIIDVEKLEDKSQEASKSSSEGNTRSRYTNLFSKNMDLDCPSWSHESSSYLGHHGTDGTIVKNVNGKDKPNSVFEKNDFSDNNSVLFEDTRKLSNIGDTEQRRTTYIAPMLDVTPNRITSDVEKLEGKSEKESKISDHRNTKSRHTNLLSVNMDLDYQSWPNKSECLGQYGTNDPLVQKVKADDKPCPKDEHSALSENNNELCEKSVATHTSFNTNEVGSGSFPRHLTSILEQTAQVNPTDLNISTIEDAENHELSDFGTCPKKETERIISPIPRGGRHVTDVAEFTKNYINLTDCDYVDQSNVSIVSILSEGDTQYEAKENLDLKDETQLDCRLSVEAISNTDNEKRQSLCRKCRWCQEALNKNAMSSRTPSAIFPETSPVKLLNLDVLRNLKKLPTITDVSKHYQKLSLELSRTSKIVSISAQRGENRDEENSLQKAEAIIESNKITIQSIKNNFGGEVPVGSANIVDVMAQFQREHLSNWTVDYQMQYLKLIRLSHHKLMAFRIHLGYNEWASSSSFEVTSLSVQKSRFLQKNWKPIDYIMEFQRRLEFPLHLQIHGEDAGEKIIFGTLRGIDEMCTVVHNLATNLWKIVCAERAALIRSGKTILVRKTVRNVALADGLCPFVKKTVFQVEIRDIRKLCFQDIVLPPLHMFREEIQSLSTGLEFLRVFLRSPSNYLK